MKAVHRGSLESVCLSSLDARHGHQPPQFSQPYFVVDAGEVKSLHALAKKQEALVPKCAENTPATMSTLTRALLGLYESRDTGPSKYFEESARRRAQSAGLLQPALVTAARVSRRPVEQSCSNRSWRPQPFRRVK